MTTTGNTTFGIEIDTVNKATLKCCQAQNTNSQTSAFEVTGIKCDGISSLTLDTCIANNLTSNFSSTNGFHFTDVADFTAKCCQSTDIQTNLADNGHGFFLVTLSGRGLLSECVAGRASSDGFRFDSVADITVKKCVSKENGQNGFGFRSTFGTNDGLIFKNNLAQANSFGYFFGFSCTNFVVKNNLALDNSSTGFGSLGVFVGEDWDDNYARNNPTNYSLVNVIQLYSKTPVGVYTLLSGTMGPPFRDINLSA